MDTELLRKKFERMGARVKAAVRGASSRGRSFDTVAIDVRADAKGEYFDIAVAPGRDLRVEAIDVRPRDRHLLLLVVPDAPAGRPGARPGPADKQKFLCGHDERHWFVAAVPEAAGASNVPTAMEALKPDRAKASQARHRVPSRHRNRRKNRGFVRQGEWFFIPAPRLQVLAALVLRDEPLQRSGGKPHRAEYAYRTGGETVYVSRLYPNGLTAEERARAVRDDPSLRNVPFRIMRRNMTVFVRGRVSHPDHKTITLNGWHRVEMNTETQAKAMQNVAFLD